LTHVLLKTNPAGHQRPKWNCSLSIQCCLLDPYGRIKVIDSCLFCKTV
jgi:hypothetical protein